MTDSATSGIKTVLHPVSDLSAAKALYTALKEPAHDVGGGRLVATVGDLDCNLLGLQQD
jgi:hypothetical protein